MAFRSWTCLAGLQQLQMGCSIESLFFNHCCGGLNNSSWTWDGHTRLQTVKAARDIRKGEEMTISYIAKPWSDFAKPARRRYLEDNFNFTCLCEACRMSPEEYQAAVAALPKKEGASSKK